MASRNRRKKNSEHKPVEKIVLATAIINLIYSIVKIIEQLIEKLIE